MKYFLKHVCRPTIESNSMLSLQIKNRLNTIKKASVPVLIYQIILVLLIAYTSQKIYLTLLM